MYVCMYVCAYVELFMCKIALLRLSFSQNLILPSIIKNSRKLQALDLTFTLNTNSVTSSSKQQSVNFVFQTVH